MRDADVGIGPDKLPAVDAAIALLVHIAHDWRGTTDEFYRLRFRPPCFLIRADGLTTGAPI
jgi:hypothetical protein